MLYYWFSIIRILIRRYWQEPVDIDETITRSYRVRVLDCDGLRVMTASKYPVYMDFIRWELIARSDLLSLILHEGLAPTLGSQKIIYRKPLAIGSRFGIKLETAGWDEKWVYHVHYFLQNDELKAVGVTRALFWKRGLSANIRNIISHSRGSIEDKKPPAWVVRLFDQDKHILEEVTR